MKKLIFSGIFAFASFHSLAQNKIEYVEYDLPNGLHVILHEERATPIVAVTMLYHVGSKNEKPDRTGFAHFFEHLLFEGSTNIERGQYDKYVEGNGGALNANTSNDRTFYYELLPSNQLELGLWLESERLLHAKVDNKGIETQRSVVKEEKRERIDNQPYATFIGEIFSRMFKNHPYNWQPIGSMEHLDAAQESDYIDFYRTFYVPSNATLCVAGDFKIEEAKAWIQKYFASIPSGQAINLYRDFENLSEDAFKAKYSISKTSFDAKNFMASKDKQAAKLLSEVAKRPVDIPRTKKTDEGVQTVVRDVIYDNIQLPGVFMAYRYPEQTHPDMYALQMMNEVLSGGASSRINKAVVEKSQLATFAFAFPYGLEDAGLGIFAAIASAGVTLEQLEAALDEQVKLIQSDLISQEEFEKVRNKFENDLVSSNATVAGVAENLANSHVYFGSADYVNQELSNLMKVTREDILRVAKKYLTQDKRIILHYLPIEKN